MTTSTQKTAVKKAAAHVLNPEQRLVKNMAKQPYFGTIMEALYATGASREVALSIKAEAFYNSNIYLPGDFHGATREEVATFLLLLGEAL